MRRARGLLGRLAAGLILLFALGASGVVCQRVAERGRYATPYSSEGAGPEGARALFLLSESLGARPQRWNEDLGRLPEEGTMLLALGGCGAVQRPLSRPEREHLLRWIEGGGVLLVAGARGYLPEELGLRMEGGCPRGEGFSGLLGDDPEADPGAGEEGEPRDPLYDPTAPREPPAEPPIDPSRGPKPLPRMDPASVAEAIREAEEAAEEEEALAPPRWATPVAAPLLTLPYDLSMREPARMRLEAGPPGENEENSNNWEILLRFLDDGAPAAMTLRRGEGRVIALASGSTLTNRDLGDHEGAVLFDHLRRAYAPTARVIFDEYHLGAGSRRSLTRYLSQAGLGPLALQILVVLALLLLPAVRRFGRPLIPAEEPAGGTASYVSAVGALYRQAEDKEATAAILARRALDRVAAHHHLGSHAPPLMIRELLRRGEGDAADAVRELASFTETARSQATRDVVEVAAKVDAAVARATASAS